MTHPDYIIIARVECQACRGAGQQWGMSDCPQCGGSGRVQYEVSLLDALDELGQDDQVRQRIQRAIGIQ